MTWYGHRIDPTRNMQRWYAIWLESDLFDYWECWTAWGRIGQRPRRRMRRAEGTQEEVKMMAERLRHQKERRGYRRVIVR